MKKLFLSLLLSASCSVGIGQTFTTNNLHVEGTLQTPTVGILLGNGTGIVGPVTIGTNLTLTGSTLNATASGSGCVPVGTSILEGNGAGGCANVTVSSGLGFTSGILSATGLPTATSTQLYGGTGVTQLAQPITLGTNLSITGTTLNATGAGGGVTSGVKYQETYYGATGTTVSGVTSDLNIMMFGAIGNGVADDSGALRNAVTQCATYGVTVNGCKIAIPAGNYLFSSTVTILQSGITIACDSSASIIVNGTTNTPAITFGDGTNIYNRNSLTGCVFAQASGVTATVGNTGLTLLKQSNFNLHNIQVFDFPSALYDGILVNGVTQSFFSNLGVQTTLNNGIRLNGVADMYLNDSRSDANGNNGWDITDSAGLYFHGVTAFGNFGNAWKIYATASHNKQFFIDDAIGDTSGGYNWLISDLFQSTFTRLWGSTQLNNTINTFANGVVLVGSAVHEVTFIGGITTFNNSHGVAILNSGGMPTNIEFDGFDFGDFGIGNGQSGISGGGYGLWIDNAPANIVVHGGYDFSNASGPVFINGASPNVQIKDLNGYNLGPRTVGTLPVCNVPVQGMTVPITNSNTVVWGAIISTTGASEVLAYCDGTNWTVAAATGAGGGGSGTVTSASVVTANGFAGTVATATTTPAISLTTTVTGLLNGNGSSVSAAPVTGSGAVVETSSPTILTPNITGVTSGSNAAAGSIGELLSNTTTGTSMTNNTPVNCASVSLTAGDWDVSGVGDFAPSAAAVATYIQIGPTLTSSTIPLFPNKTVLEVPLTPGSDENYITTPIVRFNTTTTQTLFMVAQAGFTGGTETIGCYIQARRMR